MINDETLITEFIYNTYPYLDRIKEKSKTHLFDYGEKILCEYVSKDTLKSYNIDFDEYVNLMENNIMPPKDQALLWKYLHSMVRIGINHIHLEREPTINHEGKKSYKRRYMIEIPNPDPDPDNPDDDKIIIKLNKYSKVFGVTLEWK